MQGPCCEKGRDFELRGQPSGLEFTSSGSARMAQKAFPCISNN